VASPVTLCEDATVIGAPFAMVDYVVGQVIRSRDELAAVNDGASVDRCVDSLVSVLADLHSIEFEAVGLGGFGRPDGYLERQVSRWGAQWEHVRFPDDDRDDDVARLCARLSESVPPHGRSSIVHGDYRIDNTILDSDDPTVVRAVLDWELSTLGDPLSDVASMCVYRDPDFDLVLGQAAAWTSPLLPAADELAQRYSTVAGQPLRYWSFYMALAYLKLAIIAAGIDFRRRSSGESAPAARPDDSVAPLIASGLRSLTTVGG